MATAEMGCQSITLPPKLFEELSKLTYDPSKQPGEGLPKATNPGQNARVTPPRLQKLLEVDPLAPAEWDGKLASTSIDYLANDGAELEKAIQADPPAKNRLRDALEAFISAELKSKAKIEEAMGRV